MRKLLTLIFGIFISVAGFSLVPQAVSAAPFAVGAVSGIEAAIPAQAEKAYHRRFRHGYRRYGYYRPRHYRPRYYGYRRCVVRSKVVFNGYRYVRRPVRICR